MKVTPAVIQIYIMYEYVIFAYILNLTKIVARQRHVHTFLCSLGRVRQSEGQGVMNLAHSAIKMHCSPLYFDAYCSLRSHTRTEFKKLVCLFLCFCLIVARLCAHIFKTYTANAKFRTHNIFILLWHLLIVSIIFSHVHISVFCKLML